MRKHLCVDCSCQVCALVTWIGHMGCSWIQASTLRGLNNQLWNSKSIDYQQVIVARFAARRHYHIESRLLLYTSGAPALPSICIRDRLYTRVERRMMHLSNRNRPWLSVLCESNALNARKKGHLIKEKKGKKLHRPGIGPGPPPWQGEILPLDQRCSRSSPAILSI